MIKFIVAYCLCVSMSFASISLGPSVFIGDPDCNAIALVDPANSVTDIYIVDDGKLVKVQRFDWVAERVYAKRIGGNISVVRVDMFHPGEIAKEDDICLEFYWNGELISSYSTLDITVGGADFIMYLVARKEYTVLAEDIGYIFTGEDDLYLFRAKSIRNANLFFNIKTGKRK